MSQFAVISSSSSSSLPGPQPLKRVPQSIGRRSAASQTNRVNHSLRLASPCHAMPRHVKYSPSLGGLRNRLMAPRPRPDAGVGIHNGEYNRRADVHWSRGDSCVCVCVCVCMWARDIGVLKRRGAGGRWKRRSSDPDKERDLEPIAEVKEVELRNYFIHRHIAYSYRPCGVGLGKRRCARFFFSLPRICFDTALST